MAKITKDKKHIGPGDQDDQIGDATRTTWFANQQGWLNKTLLPSAHENGADDNRNTSVTTDNHLGWY